MKNIKLRKSLPKQAYWSWDITTDSLSLSNTFSAFFGCTPNDLPSHFNKASSFFDSEDLKKVKATLTDHHKSGGEKPFQVKTTHRDIDGTESFTLHWSGEIIEWLKDKPSQVVGVAEKIADSVNHHISFREQAVLFEKLMNYLPDSIYFKDRKSQFIIINQVCADKFGLESPEEAIGKSDFDIFDEDHAQDAFEDEQEIMRTKEPIINKIEKEVINTSGEEKWASTSKFPFINDEGELLGTFGITQDVTSEQNALSELEKNNYYFDLLTKRAPGFLYLFKQDQDGKITFPYASEGVKDLFDVDPKDIENSFQPLIDRVIEEDLQATAKSIRQSISNLEFWDTEFRIEVPDKGIRWIRGRAKPQQQPDGSVISPGYITDITEEKETFESVIRLREQLQQVISSLPNFIFIKDIDGKYLMANEAAASFFGVSTSEIVGKKDVDLGISKEKAQNYIERDLEVLDRNEPLSIPEDETVLSDGSKLWHQTIKVPFLNTDSGKPAVLSVVTDITQLKQNEIELKQSLDIIGEQNKRLMNFAHIVSHNLRNHAGNISMLLSLYDMEESDIEKNELLEHLGIASKRLNESISDLNEIIDQQYSSKHDRKLVNIKETIEKIKEILTTERLAHNVSIQQDIPDDLSLKYNPAYLESIILNLLSNAIKYRHPDRKPEVTIKAENRNGSVYLEISDNGLGIDLDKYGEKLFGMYNTFHNNENSKGIGLFITKNQVESMGGTIDVESTPNEGTTFIIKLS